MMGKANNRSNFTTDIGAFVDNETADNIITAIQAYCNASTVENKKAFFDEALRLVLYTACQKGKDDIVRKLLNAGVNPNEFELGSDISYSPLNIAAANGCLKVIEELLQSKIQIGINDEIKDKDGLISTALVLAAANGHFEIVKKLIEAGALSLRSSALNIANKKGYAEIAMYLLEIELCFIIGQDELSSNNFFKGDHESAEALLSVISKKMYDQKSYEEILNKYTVFNSWMGYAYRYISGGNYKAISQLNNFYQIFCDNAAILSEKNNKVENNGVGKINEVVRVTGNSSTHFDQSRRAADQAVIKKLSESVTLIDIDGENSEKNEKGLRHRKVVKT